MHRVLVALLSAVDAALAAVVGLVMAFAPLAVLWALGGAPWSALWPTGATLWQFGNLVPLHIELPDEYLLAAGIDADAASFVLSLAPLAFAVVTAVLAVRSGARAARAGAWITGVTTGSVVFAAVAVGAMLLGANDIARTDALPAVGIPLAVYVGFALAGAIGAGWDAGDEGVLDALRARLDAAAQPWPQVPGLVLRGTALALAGIVGAASVLVGGAILWNGGEVVALYEAAHLDALGATMLTLGQLAYLPTMIVWAISWLCGPGFAVGTATAVSPAGTQLGVVPGIPVLGLLPESGSAWLLLVLAVPVASGALAGAALRRRMGLHPRTAPRVIAATGVAVLSGVAGAALAAAASGSLGPGRLADTGPLPGPMGLAIAVEILLGVSIVLFAPTRAHSAEWDETPSEDAAEPFSAVTPAMPSTGDDPGPADRARPVLLPPVD